MTLSEALSGSQALAHLKGAPRGSQRQPGPYLALILGRHHG